MWGSPWLCYASVANSSNPEIIGYTIFNMNGKAEDSETTNCVAQVAIRN